MFITYRPHTNLCSTTSTPFRKKGASASTQKSLEPYKAPRAKIVSKANWDDARSNNHSNPLHNALNKESLYNFDISVIARELLSCNTFIQLADRCDDNVVILNQKVIREIMHCGQILQNEDDNVPTQLTISQGSQIPIQLTCGEVQLLALVLKDMSNHDRELSKVVLAPAHLDQLELLANLSDRYRDLPFAARAAILSHNPTTHKPLVINLTTDNLKLREGYLDFVLSKFNMHDVQELVNHRYDQLQQRKFISPSEFFSSDEFQVLTRYVTELCLDAYEYELSQDTSSILANSPLSLQEQEKSRQLLLGKVSSNVLGALESQHQQGPSQQLSLCDVVAKITESPIQSDLQGFTLLKDSDGMVMVKAPQPNPTLDEIGPMLIALFTDPRIINSQFITEARTFGEPGCEHTALHKEMRLFLREALTNAFKDGCDLGAIANLACFFQHSIERDVDEGKLDLSSASLCSATANSLLDTRLAQTLQSSGFLREQPAIITSSTFAKDLITGFFHRVVAGDLNAAEPINAQIHSLLIDVEKDLLL